ncbi:MAG TPA: PIG-L deacetylase family protein [Desulfobacterales bacterium]|nr:PIG-L deacetylase family protein [Desulfobacterales bacterium]
MPRTTSASRATERVLVVAAHPDDPEYGCAATIAKWAAEGREVTFLLLTSGDKGSKDPAVRPGQLAARREREQREGAVRLGVSDLIFARHPDGMLENTMALRREVAGIIRHCRPHVLVTIDPWTRYQTHPDHRAAGQAALDAAYAAKELYLFPEQLVEGIEPWRIREAWLFWTENPDRWEDVGCCLDQRVAALRRHASQVDNPKKLAESIRKSARETAKKGRQAFEYAEAFKVLRW